MIIRLKPNETSGLSMCPSEPLSIAWVARLPDCAMESLRRFQTMIWTAKHAVDICGCALTPMMDDVIIIAQITNNSEERKEWTNRQKGERSATLTSSMLSIVIQWHVSNANAHVSECCKWGEGTFTSKCQVRSHIRNYWDIWGGFANTWRIMRILTPKHPETLRALRKRRH